MKRRRKQRTEKQHYCLIVNRKAGNFSKRLTDELVASIRERDGYFTFVEAATADRLLAKARFTLGLSRSRRPLPPAIARRGKFTAIVACGGDGTFNLAARLALQADIPVGLLPMGANNSIARSYFGSATPDVSAIVSEKYRTVDVARVGRLTFFGSLGLGFPVRLAEELGGSSRPVLGIGWSRLANRAAAQVKVRPYNIQVDSFIFEESPLMFSVNLSQYILGLAFSPTSVVDDGHAEIILEHGCQVGDLGGYVRQIVRGKYLYGDTIRLYRGRVVRIDKVGDQNMLLDGEIVPVPADSLEILVEEGALRLLSK